MNKFKSTYDPFQEFWNVSNGEKVFRCDREEDALYLLSVLGNWTAVKDRLPEVQGRYLVCRKYGQGRQEIIISFFRKDHNCFDDLLENIITHWMPLPEKP